VGLFSGFSSGLQTLNAEGEVINYGSLRIRGRGVVNVNSSGTWLQEGEMTVQALFTGDATLNINANGALNYIGTTPIQLGGSPTGSGRALVTINGGVLETRQGFVGTPGLGSLGYSRLTLGNFGTLRILDDVTNLTSQVQVVLENGGGIIETWGNTTLSGIVTGSVSTAAGITGTGGLVKSGSGSLTLTGTNTYTGITQVAGGTLLVDGSITRSTVIVNSGATLGGSGGSIGNGGNQLYVDDGGTLAPGASAGVLTINGSATIAGTYAYEFAGAGGGTNTDLLQVGGTLTLSGAELSLTNLGTYAVGDKFTLISYVTLFGEFTGYTDDEEFTFGGGSWRINYDDSFPGLNGGTGPLFVTVTAVPEVSAAWLWLAGVVAMARRRTR
jgi:autotransporter-associated beta strand protein